jgi:hypothetical protein
MSTTRNNHYVPQWYQEGFFETGQNTLAYLDMQPPRKVLDDGRVIVAKSLFDAPTSRAFRQLDLYSTFFGTSVNDEIERRLFGDIDTRGSKAIKAFAGADVSEWHRHFQTLFEFIDIQKIRTSKGLDWLKAQYPRLTQNELMMEMQGIRMMHCTIWSEGVREIVSAEDADVKFIVSDHPVTIYNHAVAPDAPGCCYPHDPTIALKASQTIFPLTRHYCLILTNLEYARDPSVGPLDKRTFARNFRNSMVRTDAFIRTRKLSDHEVTRINFILKARASRYIAAGRKEWLYPERTVSESWRDIAATLVPPNDELWHFGGEMFAKFDDGQVHYQDEFGRTEKQRDFLRKDPPAKPLRPRDPCGCGSARAFKVCCSTKPIALRPAWNEPSIRERNLMLYNGVANVLGFNTGKDWTQIRRDLTDDQISRIYLLYEGLWPRETDLLQLLPKPDGVCRAIYTGSIHPIAIAEFALGASLYFGELLIEHPFLHAGTVKKDYSPVENPKAYRQEFLKTVMFFLNVMPLVDAGLVNLVPDPCNFDLHLRDQMMHMAQSRAGSIPVNLRQDARMEELMKQDFQRGIMTLPRDAMRRQVKRMSPELNDAGIDKILDGFEVLKEQDPLAVLQKGTLEGGKEGGQLNVMKLAPNFEMTMYLAQATGACIVSDNRFRWAEVNRAIRRQAGCLNDLAGKIAASSYAFPQEASAIVEFAFDETFAGYRAFMASVFKYLSNIEARGMKPNVETHLNSRFHKVHAKVQDAVGKAGFPVKRGRMSCVCPHGGIQDNSVNRLLLMSSSERHLPSVPMAFFIEGQASS